MKKLAVASISLLFALTTARAEVLEAPPTALAPKVPAAEGREAAPQASTAPPPDAGDTPRPTAAEWASAARFDLARRSTDAASCEATRVRAWLRVRCQAPSLGAVKTLGANRRGELLRIEEKHEEGFWSSSGAEVIFPMRPGDRRVIEGLTLDSGYRGPSGFSTAFVISEQWIAGEPSPIVTVL